MRRKIDESGLVRKLEMPDPHLYFQASGVNASDWSESMKTYPFMRVPQRAQTWLR